MKAIVLAGSKGIGKGISDQLQSICDDVISTSSTDLDTSNIEQVKSFVERTKRNRYISIEYWRTTSKEFF